MKRIKRITVILCVLTMTVLGPVQAGQQELPQVTEDGLHRVPDSKMAIVYADPDADLAPYKRVMLLDAYVAFKKNWARDYRHRTSTPTALSSKEIERIKTKLAAEFKEVFAKVLEEGGYPVVEEPAEDVLLLRPAIINLDPNAPDIQGAGRTKDYVSSAGEMSLYVELFDSVTGDLVAKALDRKMDPDRGYYTWANSATNKAAADRILRGWANILLDALNESRQ